MITEDEARRDDYYYNHMDELLLENTIDAIKDAIRHISDDLDYIRRICDNAGVFQTCETIDISISENDIECSAWNDYNGGYLFDITLKEDER